MVSKCWGYWEERYLRYKKMTVGNIKFNLSQFEKITEKTGSVIREKVCPYIFEKIVLDFGCGFGRNVPYLLESALIVYGIDINKWALKQAEIYEPRGIYQHYNGLSIPFKDNFFEAIFSWTVLQHIPNEEIEIIIKEIDRVLTNKGTLIIYENITPIINKEHIFFRSIEEYCNLFKNFKAINLEIYKNFDEIDDNEIHALMIFEKE